MRKIFVILTVVVLIISVVGTGVMVFIETSNAPEITAPTDTSTTITP